MWKTAAGVYAPAPGGRMVVDLDSITTATIASFHRSKRHKEPMYVLLTLEGELRKALHYTSSWPEALEWGREENLIIYNARSKKAFRCVWLVPPEGRSLKNMTYEEVKLRPHEDTYFKTLPAVNAKLFDIEP